MASHFSKRIDLDEYVGLKETELLAGTERIFSCFLLFVTALFCAAFPNDIAPKYHRFVFEAHVHSSILCISSSALLSVMNVSLTLAR